MTSQQPQRLRLSRRKGYRKPEGAVVVSRPSRWGNPYVMERRDDWHERGVILVVDKRDGAVLDRFSTEEGARLLTIALFRNDLIQGRLPFTIADVRRELAGLDLCCWCPLPEPGHPDLCHAAVLIAIANGEP